MRGKSIIACYDSTSIRQEDSSTKAVPQQKQAGPHIQTAEATPPTNNPTNKPSHNASQRTFASQQPPHEATPPLHTQQQYKSRTQMKITCSYCSFVWFALHTMRGTHDKVTCSCHTRKEQPFGLQPGTRGQTQQPSSKPANLLARG